jgi:membrane-associated phospholipid phosphatase
METDLSLLLWINQGWADPGLDFLFGWLSARSFSFSMLLLLLYILIRRFEAQGLKLWLLLIFCVVMGDMLGNVLKAYFSMPRPCFDLFEALRPPGGGPAGQCDAPVTGMPSSHALNFFATAAFLAYATLWSRLSLGLFGIALLVGISRIYLAKHYPHQVLSGALIGTLFGWLFAWLGLRAFAFGRYFLDPFQSHRQAGGNLIPVGLKSDLRRAFLLDEADRPGPIALTQRLVWVPLLVCLLASLAIWLGGWNEPLFLVLNRLGPLTNDPLWANLTLLGDTLLALVLLALFARHRPDIIGAVFVAAIFATLYVHSLKPLLELARPLAALGAEQVHVIGHELRSNAFPSGHTATAFTLAGVIILRGVHPLAGLLIAVLAVLAGISRAAVGAHWPLDILAGAMGGWLSAALGVFLAQRWRPQSRWLREWAMTGFFLLCAIALLATRDLGYPQAMPMQISIALVGLAYCLFLLRNLFSRRI